MKTLEQQMGFYAAYHQDARNKATHFVGVPAIMLSLFIPLAWLRIELGGVAISVAMLFAAAVLVYYFLRSEERRVGEEGRSRWSPYHLKKKKRIECNRE